MLCRDTKDGQVSRLCWAELADDGGPAPNEVHDSRNLNASETAVDQTYPLQSTPGREEPP